MDLLMAKKDAFLKHLKPSDKEENKVAKREKLAQKDPKDEPAIRIRVSRFPQPEIIRGAAPPPLDYEDENVPRDQPIFDQLPPRRDRAIPPLPTLNDEKNKLSKQSREQNRKRIDDDDEDDEDDRDYEDLEKDDQRYYLTVSSDEKPVKVISPPPRNSPATAKRALPPVPTSANQTLPATSLESPVRTKAAAPPKPVQCAYEDWELNPQPKLPPGRRGAVPNPLLPLPPRCEITYEETEVSPPPKTHKTQRPPAPAPQEQKCEVDYEETDDHSPPPLVVRKEEPGKRRRDPLPLPPPDTNSDSKKTPEVEKTTVDTQAEDVEVKDSEMESGLKPKEKKKIIGHLAVGVDITSFAIRDNRNNLRKVVAPSGKAVTSAKEMTSSNEVTSGKKVTSGNEVTSGKKVTSGNEVTSGKEITSGKKVTSGNEVTSGKEITSGKEMTSGKEVTSGKEMTSGKEVTSGKKVTNGKKVTTGNEVPSGNEMDLSKQNEQKEKEADSKSPEVCPPASVLNPDDITSQPWYFSNLGREEATAKLMKYKEDGTYLVRDSKGNSQPYTLCLLYGGEVFNIAIRKRDDGKFALGTEKPQENVFDSVNEVVKFHRNNGIDILKKGNQHGKVKLLKIASQ